MNHPPVLIVGMHRSGTTVLSQVLDRLGLFSGCYKSVQNEAAFFRRLNVWIFLQCGATWENPEPVRRLWERAAVRSATEEYVRFVLRSPRIVSYLGARKYLRYRSLFRVRQPWSWKDPRNTFTLPLWLDVFPDARVIHILRNGIDVAESLRVRTSRVLANRRAKLPTRSLRTLLRRLSWRQAGSFSTLRCSSLTGGFSLWEEYCDEATGHVNRLGERARQLRYEDLLDKPADHIASLAEFCGLKVSHAEVLDASRILRPERAYAYKRQEALTSFANEISCRLVRHGY